MALKCVLATRRVVAVKAPGVRAVPVRPAVRRAPVKVVAYRDVHREEKICGLGSEVVNAWFKGIKMGPEAARDALRADVDSTVAYSSHQVLRHHKGQGLDYVLQRIAVGHEMMDLVSHRILATAACSLDDTFFALVEYKYKSKVLGDERINVGYSVMEMDVMYDDTCLKVMALAERSSLSPDDVAGLASLDSTHRAGNATHFPEGDLADYPAGLADEALLANSRAWCLARSSGHPESVLDSALDPSFRLWDAYGVLPVLCDPDRRGEVDACVVKYDQVQDVIRSTKDRYDLKCKVIDSAVSLTKNVGFTHWFSRAVNKDTKAVSEIEAVEVDVFGADGRLKDIWMFRDPIDVEIEMLQGGRQGFAAAGLMA
eukprot:GHRQ01000520.1.p1 GENE.GHRQ01000520.1~~GHRQ01000520.1.p1  ORF type:complete len:371 (+),score=163.02 GHRQ01000520.1:352-1464(+)